MRVSPADGWHNRWHPDIAPAVSVRPGDVLTLETRDGQEVSPVKLTRVRDAQAPRSPVSPNVPLNLALGGLVGLALGVGEDELLGEVG